MEKRNLQLEIMKDLINLQEDVLNIELIAFRSNNKELNKSLSRLFDTMNYLFKKYSEGE